jgi:hypothetical protein
MKKKMRNLWLSFQVAVDGDDARLRPCSGFKAADVFFCVPSLFCGVGFLGYSMHPMESWRDVFEFEGRLFLTGGFENVP